MLLCHKSWPRAPWLLTSHPPRFASRRWSLSLRDRADRGATTRGRAPLWCVHSRDDQRHACTVSALSRTNDSADHLESSAGDAPAKRGSAAPPPPPPAPRRGPGLRRRVRSARPWRRRAAGDGALPRSTRVTVLTEADMEAETPPIPGSVLPIERQLRAGLRPRAYFSLHRLGATGPACPSTSCATPAAAAGPSASSACCSRRAATCGRRRL